MDTLTNPDLYRRAIANYQALQRAKKVYYDANKETILAKKRQKYAETHPDAKPRRKEVADPPSV